MTNKTQIRTQRISLILALSVITYAAINTYLFTYYEINTMKVATPVILGLVVAILLCGLLHRFFLCMADKQSNSTLFWSAIVTSS